MKYLILLLLLAVRLNAATKYLDSSVASSGVGTSWATAYKTWANVSAAAGDTVYVSGGATGMTQTYTLTGTYGQLVNIGGSSGGGRITYQIGQDSLHNGTAIFEANATNNNLDLLVQSSYINFLGDAGDGLMHFKISQGQQPIGGMLDASSCSNIHVSYVDCGNIRQWFNANPVSVLEIDHCYINDNDVSASSDRASYANFQDAAAFDGSLIHDNTIRIPRIGPGVGADGMQYSGRGYSVYKNSIVSYSSSYAGGQHQDGYQDTGNSSYVKIYQNYIQDLGGYAIYGDGVNGGFANYYVYNNLVVCTDPVLAAATPGGIIFGVDGGYAGANCIFDTVVIANNVVEDYGTNQSYITLNNITGHTATYTNCTVGNNISLSSGTLGTTGNTTSTLVNNVSISSASAPSNFITYTQYGGTGNNLNIKTGSSVLIGTGTTLSTYFTTDYVGATRTNPWDIGPYKYVSGGSAGGSKMLGKTTLTGKVTIK